MTKTILVTGASRGIGRSVALLAGAKGWSVGINYLGQSQDAERVAALVRDAGGKAATLQGDVSSEADMVRVFDSAEAALGKLDGVVANAGIVAPPLPLLDMSMERMQRMFDVNVLGAFLCAREAARRLAKSRGGLGGSIVMVSSIAARFGSPMEYVDYAASKAAVDTLVLGLSKELGPEGVRVNAVRPGVTRTDIHASGGQPDRADRVGLTAPLGRPGEPDEIAEAIMWLLGDASSYVSGSLMDVSGGR